MFTFVSRCAQDKASDVPAPKAASDAASAFSARMASATTARKVRAKKTQSRGESLKCVGLCVSGGTIAHCVGKSTKTGEPPLPLSLTPALLFLSRWVRHRWSHLQPKENAYVIFSFCVHLSDTRALCMSFSRPHRPRLLERQLRQVGVRLFPTVPSLKKKENKRFKMTVCCAPDPVKQQKLAAIKARALALRNKVEEFEGVSARANSPG